MSDKMISLSGIGNGALEERFGKVVEKVLANIMDPNTEAKAARKIDVSIKIVPNEDRSTATMEYTVKSSLAPAKKRESTIIFGFNAGEYESKELAKGQAPGQISMADVVGLPKKGD